MRREKTANKFPFSPGFHYLCHMIRKANCKINIGLDVLCRREDGYHELATVMIPVYGLYDVVEVEHAAQTSFRSSGLTVDCSDADNLCMKAVRLMQACYGAGDVSVALDKRIPFGAGLGGGGVFMLFCGLRCVRWRHLRREVGEGSTPQLGCHRPHGRGPARFGAASAQEAWA